MRGAYVPNVGKYMYLGCTIARNSESTITSAAPIDFRKPGATRPADFVRQLK